MKKIIASYFLPNQDPEASSQICTARDAQPRPPDAQPPAGVPEQSPSTASTPTPLGPDHSQASTSADELHRAPKRLSISEKNKEYDKKRKRTFLESWKMEYQWILLKDDIMYCSTCLEFPNLADQYSSFIVGCNNFRKDTLKSHDTNRRHIRCREAQEARENPPNAPMDKYLRAMPDSVRENMVKLFRSAYYIAYQNKPFSDFSQIGELQNLNGAALGNTYLNDHKCREFIDAINHMFKEELKTVLSNAHMFSVLCDGSTDSGRIEEEVFYVRFVRNGEPETRFLALRPVDNGRATGYRL